MRRGRRTPGRALAPVPFGSSVYLATEFLLLAGDAAAQKTAWLPKLAAGEAIGTFAFVEGVGPVTPRAIAATVSGGVLSGSKAPVADGDIADFAVVAARTGCAGDERSISLFLVDLTGPGVARSAVETQYHRSHAQPRPHRLHGGRAQPLGAAGEGWSLISQVFDPRRHPDRLRADRRR